MIFLFEFTTFYFALLLLLTVGMFLVPKRNAKKICQGISVIIAARNEEKNISEVIKRLLKQDYPHDRFEIIIVSDRSTDDTETIVSSFRKEHPLVKLLTIKPGEKGGKKRALAKGIEQAHFPLLAFTDADCKPSENWVKELNAHFSESVDFIAGYSPLCEDKKSLYLSLKNLERLTIFAVSAGSIGLRYGMTCTGRNMAYAKSLYNHVKGFSGLEDIPSGDDDLMLQRMAPYSHKMSFMFTRDSFVPSYDQKNLTGKINQETRRASKWKYYPASIKVITALVFLFYIVFCAAVIGLIIGKVALHTVLTALIIKLLAEIILLTVFAVKIKHTKCLLLLPILEIIYIPYFLFFAVKGTLGKYRWR